MSFAFFQGHKTCAAISDFVKRSRLKENVKIDTKWHLGHGHLDAFSTPPCSIADQKIPPHSMKNTQKLRTSKSQGEKTASRVQVYEAPLK